MSELAFKLIAENKKSHSPYLDLGNCGLTKIPPEINELIWLEALSFASEWPYFEGRKWLTQITQNKGPINNITSLSTVTSAEIATKSSPFASLIKLRRLYLSCDRAESIAYKSPSFKDISPLSCLLNLQLLDISKTRVTDLSPLSGFMHLQCLFVSKSPIFDLSPLSDLVSLQRLDVWDTPVTDLSPLSELANLQQLDVRDSPVTDLAPMRGLFNLQKLNLSGTAVTDLSPLSSLTNLQELDISKMQVTDLSPLSSLVNLKKFNVSKTKVTDLTPLSNLVNLQCLDAWDIPLTNLSPLMGLSGLQDLNVSKTRVMNLLPISSLTNLQNLDISMTTVTDIFAISGLKNLQRLNVSKTFVTDLLPLSSLDNLNNLAISRTPVTDIRPLIQLIEKGLSVKSGIFWDKSDGIYIMDCQLINPPVEIVNQGNDAILNFFRETETQGTDHLYEAKVLILGEGGSGKTSLLRRLYQRGVPLPTESETTKGIDIYQHKFKLANGRDFRLNVWDFGGQEIYHATHQFFLTKRSVYILLDDTRKDDKTVHDAGFKYWLEVVDLLGDHSPVLIFQNEKGGRSKTIDESGIRSKFNNVKEFYRGNLEQLTSTDDLRKAIEFFAQNLPHVGEELPAKWVFIRSTIEQQAQEKPFISQQDYFDIYRKNLEFDRDKALHLSRYLHDLGVFLHFQDEPLLARTVILQNAWATEAVFKILDDEIVKFKLGHFDSSDYKRVWQDSIYTDMHLELLRLMQKFELCYCLPDSDGDTWLAPQLLQPSKPFSLSDCRDSDTLILRYRYHFLPKGIISRLIVRMHRFIKRPELSWISGAFFERDGSEVLAEVTAKGGEIILHARGPERKELLNVISADLDALNDSFHGLKDMVSKCVPCNCSRCRKLNEPEFFDQKRLLNRKLHGKLSVECPESFETVDVLEMLDGIRVDQLPTWAKGEGFSNPLSNVSETKIQTIKIFLASSSELKEDRDAFDLYFRQQNDRLRKQGIYLEIIRWENFLDVMSETRFQDEYNQKIKDCDIFISLFFSKTGKYTEEEFDTAHRHFLNNRKPLIYTFFKNAPLNSGDIEDEIISLLYFKKKLASLGHFFTNYDNIEHLKRQFNDQLEKLRESGNLIT